MLLCFFVPRRFFLGLRQEHRGSRHGPFRLHPRRYLVSGRMLAMMREEHQLL